VIEAAIKALVKEGGVILYPTETVYGLGGRASDMRSAERIAAIKGRGLQPLIVLVKEAPTGLPPLASALAKAFWPGPLTLIVPADGRYPKGIQGPEGTIALRCSPHPVVCALVDAVGPISSTSANKSGEAPLSRADQIQMPVDAVVDAGPIPPSLPSTLVHHEGRILRDGALAKEVRAFVEAWFAGKGSTA
jgi:L-threonylcarbamoyladenylate synthase